MILSRGPKPKSHLGRRNKDSIIDNPYRSLKVSRYCWRVGVVVKLSSAPNLTPLGHNNLLYGTGLYSSSYHSTILKVWERIHDASSTRKNSRSMSDRRTRDWEICMQSLKCHGNGDNIPWNAACTQQGTLEYLVPRAHGNILSQIFHRTLSTYGLRLFHATPTKFGRTPCLMLACTQQSNKKHVQRS